MPRGANLEGFLPQPPLSRGKSRGLLATAIPLRAEQKFCKTKNEEGELYTVLSPSNTEVLRNLCQRTLLRAEQKFCKTKNEEGELYTVLPPSSTEVLRNLCPRHTLAFAEVGTL